MSFRLLHIPHPHRPIWTFRVLNRHRKIHGSPRIQDYPFDTHHFVQRLEREGLNRAQAEGIMNAMAEVMDESIRNMTSTMVTKTEQEKVWHSNIDKQ